MNNKNQTETYLQNKNSQLSDKAKLLNQTVINALTLNKSDLFAYYYKGYDCIVYGRNELKRDGAMYLKILKDSINLGFYNGSELKDPHKLLIGTGKKLRHIKFKMNSELNQKIITELVTECLNTKS